jgi:outer membrane protein TolC
MKLACAVSCVLVLPSAALPAQLPTGAGGRRDSLRLSALYGEAVQRDPRQRQLQLYAEQTELRLRNIAAERFPTLSAEGQAQYQSDVTTVPTGLGGLRPVSPPHDTYDARVVAQQQILDPTRGPRRAAERAQLTEAQAQVRASLFALRPEVNEAFFTAAALQERMIQIEATIADLEARQREAGARVREGASLPSDTASLDAVILQRRQDVDELRANRRAALARLAQIVGRDLNEADVLVLPDLVTATAQARASLGDLRARPEYQEFAGTRERIARQSDVVASHDRPHVSAFARAGYGKPGLNQLNNTFDSYWLAGVQVQWTPLTWGAIDREREALALQQQIVTANEAAFTESLLRAVQADIAAVDRLEGALALDDRIIALRDRIEREFRVRLQEGVITSAEYADRNTDLLQARLTRASHLVELSQARVHLLTTLGLEVR